MLFVDTVKRSDYWLPFCENALRGDLADWADYIGQMKKTIAAAPVFEISNVANYFYLGTGQEEWSIFEDFSRPVPPFEKTWFEWKLPLNSLNGNQLQPLEHALCFERIGVLFSCSRLAPATRAMLERHGFSLQGAAFNVNIYPFGRAPGLERPLMLPAMRFGLSEDFRPLSVAREPKQVEYLYPGVDRAKLSGYPDAEKMGKDSCSIGAYVPLLAISMLNCKNVTTRQVNAAAALIRKHAKRGHPITPQHNVIEIQPISETIRRQTGREGYSRQAAAIIRGHFKDYSKGNGLFGKVRGMFWWSQHLTGNVEKQYRLAAAAGELDEQWPELLKKKT